MESSVIIPVFLSLYLVSSTYSYVINADSGEEQAGITCWTCPNKTDNDDCNNWAPDYTCPINHTVCQSFHKYDGRTGKSIEVHKRCAKPVECTIDMVGCKNGKHGILECMTCCDQDYCNEFIPTNHTAALMLSTFTSGSSCLSPSWTLFVSIIITLRILHSLTSSSS